MESMRLSAIQSALEATLRHKDAQDIETNSQQERPEFDFSFAPICKKFNLFFLNQEAFFNRKLL